MPSHKKIINYMIFLIIAIIAFFILTSLLAFLLYTKPAKIKSSITPDKLGLNYEEIYFTTSDHIKLRGWYIPKQSQQIIDGTANQTIIILHGYPADKGDVLPTHAFLAEHYNLLLFDFRRLGDSGGKFSTVGANEVNDLLAAVEYLKSKNISTKIGFATGGNEIGLLGFSMGGAVALMATPQVPEIKAVAANSAYASLDLMLPSVFRLPIIKPPLIWLTKLWMQIVLGINIKNIAPMTAAKNINIPTLIIHSKNDQVIPFIHAQLIQTALEHNPQAEFLFHEQIHGGLPLNYQVKILEFFQKHL